MTQKTVADRSPMIPGKIYSMEIVAVPVKGGRTVLNVTFPAAHGLTLDQLKTAWADLSAKLWEPDA